MAVNYVKDFTYILRMNLLNVFVSVGERGRKFKPEKVYMIPIYLWVYFHLVAVPLVILIFAFPLCFFWNSCHISVIFSHYLLRLGKKHSVSSVFPMG